MKFARQRQELVEACQQLLIDGLVVGTAGNASMRIDDSVLISPSGFDYRVMKPEHIVEVNLQGETLEGTLKPSSELPLHLSIYHSTNHQAIVHTHAVSSTALSLVVDEVPTSHYYSAMFGGAVRVAPYATFGSAELAENVRVALQDRTAALMSNHGAVSVSMTLHKAYDQLQYLEYICEIQLKAMATGKEIKVLSAEEIAKVHSLLSNYGQKA
ncbi:MAG: class aldolase [Actinomycetota bacterium]|jgi:L-fuculose-phosphate aldolase